jgi:hypothetical protein
MTGKEATVRRPLLGNGSVTETGIAFSYCPFRNVSNFIRCLHSLLNILLQIAYKMGLEEKIYFESPRPEDVSTTHP